ncbi:hypothetical protein D3C86_1917820 [compost metagenome]
MSTPISSSSSLTRRPMVALSRLQTTRETAKTQPKMVAAPSNWAPKVALALENGTTIRPNRPHTPCTEMAPTGSSIFRRSKATMA